MQEMKRDALPHKFKAIYSYALRELGEDVEVS